MDINLHILEN